MKKLLVYITLLCSVTAIVPSLAFAVPHGSGVNIKTTDGTIYMISPDGTRRPYTSAGAFLSYGFNSWSNVTTASQEDLYLPVGAYIPPQDGKIICSDRGTDKGTCYLISQSKKIGFPSEEVFKNQGFSFSQALYGDVSFITLDTPLSITDSYSAHKAGTLINKDSTIYLVSGNGAVMGIPNLEIFNSWGFKFSDVVPANSSDLPLSVTANLSMRNAGLLNPFYSSNANSTYSSNAKVFGTSPSSNIRYVSAGQQDAAIFSFRIDASSQKDLQVQGFEFEIKYYPDEQSADGLVTLTSVKDVTNPSIATNISSSLSGMKAQTTFNGSYITIPAGQSKEFMVYANMSPYLNSGYLGITLKRVMNTYNAVVENDNFINGVIQVSGGTTPYVTNTPNLSATISLYTPKTTVYTGTQTEIFDVVIKAPSNGSITIQQLGYEFAGNISPSNLSNLKIFHWEKNTQVGSNSGNILSYNSISMLVNPAVTISNGGSAEFILKADISSAATGQTIQPKLTQVWTSNTNGVASLATVTGVPLTGSSLSIQGIPASYVQKMVVTSPVDKEIIQTGSTKYITWTWSGASTLNSLSIKLMKKNSEGGYTEYQVISSYVPNTGSYAWYVPSSLPSGKYYVIIQDQYIYDAYDDSSGDFIINNPSIPESNTSTSAINQRDAKRLADIRQIASALELYFNYYNAYPVTLESLVPTYIGIIPSAPTPTDGTCSTSQNSYIYTSQNSNNYLLTFCLGAASSGYSAGYHYLSPGGIY